MKRVIFYFDGFNFYYGLRDKKCIEPQWQNYFWIDLVKFCEQFIDTQNSELTSVKYFTSPPRSNVKRTRQSAFLNVNKTLNPDKFFLFNGQYQDKPMTCEATCKENFVSIEEKRTDVNIALQILLDCVDDKVDTVVLISADSDQIPTIQTIKNRFPKIKVRVYFPPERICNEIMRHVNPVVYLGDNENKFKAAILPGEVIYGDKKYTKPPEWKIK